MLAGREIQRLATGRSDSLIYPRRELKTFFAGGFINFYGGKVERFEIEGDAGIWSGFFPRHFEMSALAAVNGHIFCLLFFARFNIKKE